LPFVTASRRARWTMESTNKEAQRMLDQHAIRQMKIANLIVLAVVVAVLPVTMIAYLVSGRA
jgi:hypothetical protein